MNNIWHESRKGQGWCWCNFLDNQYEIVYYSDRGGRWELRKLSPSWSGRHQFRYEHIDYNFATREEAMVHAQKLMELDFTNKEKLSRANFEILDHSKTGWIAVLVWDKKNKRFYSRAIGVTIPKESIVHCLGGTILEERKCRSDKAIISTGLNPDRYIYFSWFIGGEVIRNLLSGKSYESMAAIPEDIVSLKDLVKYIDHRNGIYKPGDNVCVDDFYMAHATCAPGLHFFWNRNDANTYTADWDADIRIFNIITKEAKI